MKKFLCAFAVLFLSIMAFAQLQEGQQVVNGRLGLGFQTQNSGIVYSSSGSRVDWGSLGAEIGIEYQYLVSKYLGLGAEFSYGDFDGGDFTWSSSDKVDDHTNLYRLMLAGRFNINPDNRVRLYVPFGLGLNIATQDLSIKYGGTSHNKKTTDCGFGAFIGAGIEFDVGHNGWSWGFDTRYNIFYYDTEKIVSGAPSPIKGDGNRRYEYMIFNLNITKRF